MTEQQIAAMRQALEALNEVTGWQWAGPMRVMDEVEDAITALTAALEQPAQQEPVAHSIVAGALFDFMGWLTSRKERLVLSSVDDASPAVEVIKQFAEMRCLSLDKANVKEWQEHLYTRPAQQEPVIDKSAAIRIATALGWEPKREPLTDEDLIECERLADIRHRKHMGSIRGQQLSPADQFLWHYARAIEAAHGIKGDA